MSVKVSHRRLCVVTALGSFVLAILCLRYQVFFQSERILQSRGGAYQHNHNVMSIELSSAVVDNITNVENGTRMAAAQHPHTSVPKQNTHWLKPDCENVLENISIGKWVKRVDLLDKNDIEGRKVLQRREADIEDELKSFWVKRGIQKGFWRPDHRCGYWNYEEAPENSTWPKVGSWCNARGERPCCTDVFYGKCTAPSPKTCECPSCVDLRRYLHADVSDWLVVDARCRWRNFSAPEACEVVERSPFTDLHFIGDSFMRNMFRTFLMLLTGDTVRGAWSESMTKEVRERCTEMQQFFWKECRHNVLNMSELIYAQELCGGTGRVHFTASMQPYYSPKFGNDFYNLTIKSLGKTGTLFIISVGFHMGCVPSLAIANFLGPAVAAIEKYYSGPIKSQPPKKLSGRWPQIILALPLSIGLLKPPGFLKLQNERKCGEYSIRMMEYAAKHDIRILDFRQLTAWVHSFDGTHHGINVNLVKNQMLLNYIASLDTS